MNTKTVKSFIGVFTILILFGFASGVVSGGFLIMIAIRSVPIDVFTLIFGILYSLVLGLIFLLILTERYVVSLNGISKINLWGKWFIEWKDVASITVAPGYGYVPLIGYNIIIHPRLLNKRPFAVSAALYSNSRKVVKAILEASVRSKKPISIKGSLLDNYGAPPYGIFEIK